MLCYQDKTFCTAPCATTECNRKFTDEVVAGAKAWLGDDAPIAIADLRDECADYVEEK